MIINVLISTIDDRIKQVPNVILAPRDDVRYIVSHQYTDEKYKFVPVELDRFDVVISHITGKGIAKSRNNAINFAKGDIGLLSDDDVTYRNSDFDTLKKIFLQHHQVDVAIFKIRTPLGEAEYRPFPDKIVEYKNVPRASSIQIAFRINSIKQNHIWFDERFGVGQPLLINSEEQLFLHDCINSGLKMVFFPEYVVEHPYVSTSKGVPKYDIRKNWIVGGLDCRINGPIALVKAFLGTLKIIPDLAKHRINPFRYFFHRISAVIYILKTNEAERIKLQHREIPVEEHM